jgi:hypothetical protein
MLGAWELFFSLLGDASESDAKTAAVMKMNNVTNMNAQSMTNMNNIKQKKNTNEKQ